MNLSLTFLLDTYKKLKAHDNEIMSARPEATPRGAWRAENPHNLVTSWPVRVKGRKGRYVASINFDTKPELIIREARDGGRVVDMIELHGEDAEMRLATLEQLPRQMTGEEVIAAKATLGRAWGLNRPLHNSELARALRLTGRDPGRSVQDWSTGQTRVSGPAAVAIEMMLAGGLPAHVSRRIVR
jgi:hypothetical protein